MAGAAARPGRHAALVRGARPRFVAGVVLVALLALVVVGHGTFALWSSSAKAAGAGTVRSGTAGLNPSGLPPMSTTILAPGSSTYGAFSVTNTGNVSLSMRIQTSSTKVSYASATDATVLSNLTLHLASVASASDCKAGLSGASGSLATFDTGSGYYTMPVGATAWACVEIVLSAGAPQSVSGAVTDFVLTVSGTQVPS